MRLGNPERFAVEFEFDDSVGREWLSVQLRYWVEGACVGEYENSVTLHMALLSLARVVKDSGKREHGELAALPTGEVFRRLHEALHDPDSPDAQRATDELWARFQVGPGGLGSFDGWRVFLVDTKEGARLLYGRPHQDDTVREARLPPGEFDRLLRETYEQLDQRYELELG